MSYIGQGLPADTFQGFVTDSFTGDGSATTFTLSKEPFSEDTLIVVINNVIQKPTTNFTVSGTTLTIVGTAVADGDVIYAIHMGGPLPIGGASELDLNGASDKLILDADADTTISADTDDQIDFKAGGTDIMSLTATTATINDGLTVTVDDNSDTITVKSTDADASSGPVINMVRDSASPADSDSLGRIHFTGDNDAGEATIFARIKTLAVDVSDGSEDGQMRISRMVGGGDQNVLSFLSSETVFNDDSKDIDFRVEGDGDTHAIFVQGSNDHVGIGTSSPGNKLTVSDNAADLTLRVNNTKTSGGIYGQLINFSYAPDDNSNHFLYCADTVANRFFVLADGDVRNHDNSYGQVSDERIKQNIKDANSQWDDIKALKVRNFERKDDVAVYGEGKKVQIGLIAQECEAVSPGLVKESEPMAEDIKMSSEFGTLNEDGTIKTTTGEKVKGISYSVLYMKAIKALQEAMAKIETLETKVKALEDA